MSRILTGTLLLPDGTPAKKTKIFLIAKRIEPASILTGVSNFFVTDELGFYSQSVVDGWYDVSVESSTLGVTTNVRRWPLGSINVTSDAGSISLNALLIAENPPENPDLGIFYELVSQASAFASSALQSAEEAAESAATFDPSQFATAVQGGKADTALQPADIGTGANSIPNNTQLNVRLGTTGNLGTAAQRSVGTATSNLPDIAQLNVRLGTSGNLGTLAQQNSTSVNVTALTATGYVASKEFSPGLSSGIANLDAGLRWFSSGTYTYGIGVSSASGGMEYHSLQGSAGVHRWYTGVWNAPVIRMNLSQDGMLSVTGGFQPGNLANTSPNVLDWYDEGSFTPTVAGGGVVGSATYSLRTGRYQRIGNRVHFQINVVWTGHTGSGSISVTGLPFASSAAAANAIPSMYTEGFIIGDGYTLQGFISPNGSKIDFDRNQTSTGSTFGLTLPVAGILLITGSYEV